MDKRVRYISGTAIYTAPLPVEWTPSATALAAVDGVGSGRRRNEIMGAYHIACEVFGRDAVIGHDALGAPFIEGYAGHLSISHCADMIVMAVNPDGPVGVDVELWRPKLLGVRNRFLNRDEMSRVTSNEEILHAWTVKEAVYKIAAMPGLPLLDIHLPDRGGSVATVASGGAEMRFTVHAVERSPLRAITLVTP